MNGSQLRACLLGWLACCCRTAVPETQRLDVSVGASMPGPSSPAPIDEARDARAVCLADVGRDLARPARLERALRIAEKRGSEAVVWADVGTAWLTLAESSGDAGFGVNADACASAALALDAEHPRALEVRARVLLTRHEFKAARSVAEAILSSQPDDLAALRVLSDATLELGDMQSCERAVQRLMDLEPNLAAYSRAAYLRWLHGEVREAIELMRLAIDAAGDPDAKDARAWALTQAALMFWHQGDYEGAEAGFSLALDVRANHAPALVGRARVALARSDDSAARELLGRAFELHPDVETARLLAEVLARLGDAAGAAANDARAEQLGRSDPRALSLFYSARGSEPKQALALAQAELVERGDIYTRDALAWALHRSGQHALAEEHIGRALQYGTPDARLLYHAGAIALGTGHVERGRALLRRALSLNPHFDLGDANAARRLLGVDT